MPDIKEKFGTSNQAITCTLNSLASAGLRQSTMIDNSTNLFLNALVGITVVSNAAGVSTTGYVNVYAYASVDGGTNYTGGASGTDTAYTADKLNLRFIGSLSVTATSTTYKGTFDVASAFGGVLPERWGIVVENLSGAAFAASGNAAVYQGVLNQSV